MFFRLLFLLTFIPFIEIYFLIRLSDEVGFSNTLLLIIFTGVVGAWMLRRQGSSILKELNQKTVQNHLPSETVAKGLFIFIGGLLLLTPGVLTDLVGFSLIFPLTQNFWKNYFMSKWQQGVASGQIHVFSRGAGSYRASQSGPTQPPRPPSSDIIDIKAHHSQTVDKKLGED